MMTMSSLLTSMSQLTIVFSRPIYIAWFFGVILTLTLKEHFLMDLSKSLSCLMTLILFVNALPGWLPTNVIKKTFNMMTQYAQMPFSSILKKCFKSPNPALNVMHCNEPIATDTIQLDTPAINGGEMYAQIFVGTKTLLRQMFMA